MSKPSLVLLEAQHHRSPSPRVTAHSKSTVTLSSTLAQQFNVRVMFRTMPASMLSTPARSQEEPPSARNNSKRAMLLLLRPSATIFPPSSSVRMLSVHARTRPSCSRMASRDVIQLPLSQQTWTTSATARHRRLASLPSSSAPSLEVRARQAPTLSQPAMPENRRPLRKLAKLPLTPSMLRSEAGQ